MGARLPAFTEVIPHRTPDVLGRALLVQRYVTGIELVPLFTQLLGACLGPGKPRRHDEHSEQQEGL